MPENIYCTYPEYFAVLIVAVLPGVVFPWYPELVVTDVAQTRVLARLHLLDEPAGKLWFLSAGRKQISHHSVVSVAVAHNGEGTIHADHQQYSSNRKPHQGIDTHGRYVDKYLHPYKALHYRTEHKTVEEESRHGSSVW